MKNPCIQIQKIINSQSKISNRLPDNNHFTKKIWTSNIFCYSGYALKVQTIKETQIVCRNFRFCVFVHAQIVFTLSKIVKFQLSNKSVFQFNFDISVLWLWKKCCELILLEKSPLKRIDFWKKMRNLPKVVHLGGVT